MKKNVFLISILLYCMVGCNNANSNNSLQSSSKTQTESSSESTTSEKSSPEESSTIELNKELISKEDGEAIINDFLTTNHYEKDYSEYYDWYHMTWIDDNMELCSAYPKEGHCECVNKSSSTYREDNKDGKIIEEKSFTDDYYYEKYYYYISDIPEETYSYYIYNDNDDGEYVLKDIQEEWECDDDRLQWNNRLDRRYDSNGELKEDYYDLCGWDYVAKPYLAKTLVINNVAYIFDSIINGKSSYFSYNNTSTYESLENDIKYYLVEDGSILIVGNFVINNYTDIEYNEYNGLVKECTTITIKDNIIQSATKKIEYYVQYSKYSEESKTNEEYYYDWFDETTYIFYPNIDGIVEVPSDFKDWPRCY